MCETNPIRFLKQRSYHAILIKDYAPVPNCTFYVHFNNGCRVRVCQVDETTRYLIHYFSFQQGVSEYPLQCGPLPRLEHQVDFFCSQSSIVTKLSTQRCYLRFLGCTLLVIVGFIQRLKISVSKSTQRKILNIFDSTLPET